MRTCKYKLSKTVNANKSADVPERVSEEEELLPFLPFPLYVWRNICTHLKNKRLIYLIIVNCIYQKSSASEFASTTSKLCHSHLSCFLASHFDFRRRFF
jgi:hypothetical protein